MGQGGHNERGRAQEKPILTRREIEVLTHIADGKSSKETAELLFVSKRTVDFHLANIYHKLEATNRFQAFTKAMRLGVIPPRS